VVKALTEDYFGDFVGDLVVDDFVIDKVAKGLG